MPSGIRKSESIWTCLLIKEEDYNVDTLSSVMDYSKVLFRTASFFSVVTCKKEKVIHSIHDFMRRTPTFILLTKRRKTESWKLRAQAILLYNSTLLGKPRSKTEYWLR